MFELISEGESVVRFIISHVISSDTVHIVQNLLAISMPA